MTGFYSFTGTAAELRTQLITALERHATRDQA